jgi:tetratricopeptide (TPR) repeat protein
MAAFLIPILGGALYVDATSLAPGPGAFLQTVFRGADLPQAQYLLLTLPLAAALAVLLIRGRILAMPSQQVASLLAVFLGLLALSIFPSPVKMATFQAVLNWATYLLGFFVVSAAVGRVRGPMIVVAAIVAGCGILALSGVLEWGATKATDPTWRIFAGWNNPNALAGMLIVGLVLSLALQCATEGSVSLLAGVIGIVVGLALFLTQSRGGLAAAGLGVLAFLPALLKTGPEGRFNRSGLLKTVVTLSLASVMVAMAILSTHSAQGNAGSRLAGTAATAQSTGFRKLLWESSADMIKADPAGTGLNSFGTVSTRPGLTTQTLLAHSSLLELGVEASILAPLVLIAVVALWFWKGLKSPRQEPSMRLLAAGVRAAVFAMLVDGLAESNLYFFGTGMIFFMLLGLGLQLSADSVSPEVAPAPFRTTLLIALAFLLSGSGYFALVETMKARARFDRDTDPTAFAADISALKTVAPGDGETYYLAAFVPTIDQRERLSDLEQALSLSPSSKIARALANAQVRMGQQTQAILTLSHALDHDPNNLLTLTKLLDLQNSAGSVDDADKTAQRIIEIESKPYFKVRSIPEVVPLQTAQARVFLAGHTTDGTKKAELLQGAVDLYLKYAETTVGSLIENIKRNGPNYSLADETADTAHSHLEEGHQLAAQLADLYRDLGKTVESAGALSAGKTLLDAEGRLADVLTSSR